MNYLKTAVNARLTVPAGTLLLSLPSLGAADMAASGSVVQVVLQGQEQRFLMNAPAGVMRPAAAQAGVFEQLEVRGGSRPSYRYRLAAGALSLDLWYLTSTGTSAPAWTTTEARKDCNELN
jgi:hypothetical protein